ncbi:cyclin-dependent kinase inhibitor 3-like isoform X2 [Acanthaster planci]|nr:cyclin-dependent kinase inhibitor 3-like isoform X2 [Acanthaster planci]XP_022089123.1 cyclin-dependent kinase inhibitor 3-like isoform X2 [Acanthaster planci]
MPEDVEMEEEDGIDKNESCEFDTSDDDQPFDTSPLKIDWLDLSAYGLPGQLGVSAIPGCRFGEVWRKLKPDIDDLKRLGITDVFLLCTNAELLRYRVPTLLTEYAVAQFGIHHLPMEDGANLEVSNILGALQTLRDLLAAGKKVLLHCYGGLGRSCLVAACLLLQLDPGLDSETAIQKVRELRGHKAIETVKQYNFINDFRQLAEDCQEALQAVPEQRSISR